MSREPVYLDYNATAPLAPEAALAMSAWLRQVPANPASAHVYGQRARAAIEEARAGIAVTLDADPIGLVFTSGGTEADNQAIQSAVGDPPEGHLVVSAVEHPAVLEPAATLQSAGVEVTLVGVDAAGRVDPDDVRRALRPDTRLVSVMAANNEVGTLQPVVEIGAIAREAGVLFHCDAVQAAPWMDLTELLAVADMVTITAHKMGGPPGIGALWVRPGVVARPLVRGGSQQGGRRAGTEATALVVGFSEAARRVARRCDEEARRVGRLRDRLETGIRAGVPGAFVSGGGGERLPNTSHLCLEACDGIALVARLDLDGVAASAGSACAAGVTHPSHVLEAMGVPPRLRGGALRLSLGYETGEEDVERAIETVVAAVAGVRAAGVGTAR